MYRVNALCDLSLKCLYVHKLLEVDNIVYLNNIIG